MDQTVEQLIQQLETELKTSQENYKLADGRMLKRYYKEQKKHIEQEIQIYKKQQEQIENGEIT